MSEKELSNYYWLKKEIKYLEDKIIEFGCGLGSIKFDDEIKGGSTNNTVQDKVLFLRESYIEKRVKALEEYLKIDNYISTIEDSEIRTIMRLRFLDLKNWNQIADELSTKNKYVTDYSIKKKFYRYFKKIKK